MLTQEKAKELLTLADLFFEEDSPQLNMNDVWGWACADGQEVIDEQLPELADLFWRYGWCGILYWASEQNEQCRSEFHHYNRMIDFVRNEEALRKNRTQTELAYHKTSYMLGDFDG